MINKENSQIRQTRRLARKDAKLGINQPDAVIHHIAGPKQDAYDPDAPENEFIKRDLVSPVDAAKREELQDRIRNLDEQISLTQPPWLLKLVIGALATVEIFASIKLLAYGDSQPVERVAYGLALASLLVALFMFLRWAHQTGRRGAFWAAVAVAAMAILAFTFIRADRIIGEDTSALTAMAFAILMTLVTVGPAVGIEFCLVQHEISSRLRRQRRNARRELKQLETKYENAKRTHTGNLRRPGEVQALHDRLRAVYESEWRRYTAAHNNGRMNP